MLGEIVDVMDFLLSHINMGRWENGKMGRQRRPRGQLGPCVIIREKYVCSVGSWGELERAGGISP